MLVQLIRQRNHLHDLFDKRDMSEKRNLVVSGLGQGNKILLADVVCRHHVQSFNLALFPHNIDGILCPRCLYSMLEKGSIDTHAHNDV